jgi:uncharacterized protein (UPF0262 family)
MTTADTQRLSDVVLDETIGRATPDVEHERAVAIFDLIEENSFEPVGHDKGPYKLKLSLDRFQAGVLDFHPGRRT